MDSGNTRWTRQIDRQRHPAIISPRRSELVVNGYDADATIVTVANSSEAIVIDDNGADMGIDSINDQFLVRASGHKRRTGKTPVFKRDPIGAKGIGKLAGLGIARRIEVESWQDGVMSRFAIDRGEMERAERSSAGEPMDADILDRCPRDSR